VLELFTNGLTDYSTSRYEVAAGMMAIFMVLFCGSSSPRINYGRDYVKKTHHRRAFRGVIDALRRVSNNASVINKLIVHTRVTNKHP